jgi:hypothetical protein
MMQVGYTDQWHTMRDDLGMMRTMGAGTVFVPNALGAQSYGKKTAFLDRAHQLGLNLIVGFQTPAVCPNFNCSATWKNLTMIALKDQGFMRNHSWHPAVKAVMLLSRPESLSFMTGGRVNGSSQPNCTLGTSVCATKAVLSALDGFLQGEKAAGVNGSNVSLGVTWNFQNQSAIDSKVHSFRYGFENVKNGIRNSSSNIYKFQFKDV